jgi:RNA polymerase sigma-70 factor (ECF subfamily)
VVEAGADQRFTLLHGQHHDAIRAYCRRRLKGGDADDAVAEVFTIAWRRFGDVPSGDNALYWLYAVAGNVVRNQRRGTARRMRLRARTASITEAPQDGPELQVIRIDVIEGVLRSLATLPEADQEILRLHTWEELSRSQMAEVLDISVEAVDMRVNRAKKRMAKAMQREGVADHYRDQLTDRQEADHE